MYAPSCISSQVNRLNFNDLTGWWIDLHCKHVFNGNVRLRRVEFLKIGNAAANVKRQDFRVDATTNTSATGSGQVFLRGNRSPI